MLYLLYLLYSTTLSSSFCKKVIDGVWLSRYFIPEGAAQHRAASRCADIDQRFACGGAGHVAV
jgi:hypothetical protein